MADISVEPQKYIWMIDVREKSNPVTIATLPLPADRDYIAGRHFRPPQSLGEPPRRLRERHALFATFQSAGVRVYDINDPFRPKETAFFVPPPPRPLLDPRPGIKLISHCADLYVTVRD